MKMVKAVPIFCVAALVALSMPWFAWAQDPENLTPDLDFPLVGEISADRVNLRTGPSVDFRILRKLQPGEKLVVVARNDTWFKVRVPGGYTGYVLAALAEMQGAKTAVVNKGRVNVRPTASTRYFPAGQVSKGEELLVVGREGDWLEIHAPSHLTAWVSMEYVRILGPESDHEAELRSLADGARKALVSGAKGGEQAVEEAMVLEIRGAFDSAEALLAEAKAAENPDFEGAIDLYEKVAQQTLLPELAQSARIRLDAINRVSNLQASLREAEEIRGNLESDLAQARQTYENEIEEIKRTRRESSATARARNYEVGWLVRNTPLNPFDTTQPDFRLLKGGRTICYLQSTKYDLKDFIDRQVIVSGEVAKTAATDLRVMIVRRLEILAKR